MRERLLKLYEYLYAEYGAQNWWPAETPFEVSIGAILVQSTAWENVVKAINNLKAADFLTPERLGEIPQTELETLIRPSGYYRVKAKKIRAFLEHLRAHHQNRLASLFARETWALRKELLSIYGIGEETADSILLYAAEKPIFVVDAYTHRLFTRLGWVNGKYHYDRLQSIFISSLPPDVQFFNEYHALIVRHGKETCRKRPRCEGCVLRQHCPYPLNLGINPS
ncbi:endonuclease III domain-containing protein [Candidatus Poribacteria bacterium]|nr:endonuclease III domain-containing protein [Candidatus Poribacteria bacterium]